MYIYDQRTYQLQKLLTTAESNITALAWETTREKLLAKATMDKKVVVWDVEQEAIKFEV